MWFYLVFVLWMSEKQGDFLHTGWEHKYRSNYCLTAVWRYMDRLTEVLHSGLLFCQGILFFECFWWFPSYFGNDEETSSLKGLEIVQTYIMVRLTEPSCELWCTSCIWVCCCPYFPLHEWKLCFWRCYPVSCCLVLSFDSRFELVEGALMTTHESNHSEQAVWTRMVRLPEKPLPVLMCFGPIYILTVPDLHVHVLHVCVCVFLTCMFSVDVGKAGWFLHMGW